MFLLPCCVVERKFLPHIFICFRIMATCSVRFEFWFDRGSNKLEFIHDFPNSLITACPGRSATAQSDGAYPDLFLHALRSITKTHEADCLAASNDYCGICGFPTEDILQIPLSWLHKPEDPYIALWVSAICGSKDCKIYTQQRAQAEITELILASQARKASE